MNKCLVKLMKYNPMGIYSKTNIKDQEDFLSIGLIKFSDIKDLELSMCQRILRILIIKWFIYYASACYCKY